MFKNVNKRKTMEIKSFLDSGYTGGRQQSPNIDILKGRVNVSTKAKKRSLFVPTSEMIKQTNQLSTCGRYLSFRGSNKNEQKITLKKI